MKRLTFEGNFCDIAQCAETRGGSFCEDGACSQRKVWERLKEWEDLEEQGWTIVMKGPEQDGMARLRELAESDRPGRKAVVWCKDCRYAGVHVVTDTHEIVGHWCGLLDIDDVSDDDFCSFGKRKENENDG